MKYIKGSLLIIFVAMCVFFSIGYVEAKSVKSCLGTNCAKICEYEVKHNSMALKDKNRVEQTGTITIYAFNDDKLSVDFIPKEDSRTIRNFGPATMDDIYNNTKRIFWKSKIKNDLPHCPKYGYIDLHILSGWDEVCFDSDGSSCEKTSNLGTSFGKKSGLFINTKKTYDVFSTINNNLANDSMKDLTCDDLKNNNFDMNAYIEKSVTPMIEKDVFNGKTIPTIVLKYLDNKNSTVQNAVQTAKNKKDRECINQIKNDTSLTDDQKQQQIQEYNNASGSKDAFQGTGKVLKTLIERNTKGVTTDFAEIDCDTLLGDKDKDGDEAPIYWIDLGFNVIKYIAIIALIVLSTIDFMKAVVVQDNDALQKAIRTTVKRLIFAVMIFFLPILVDFVLDVLEISGSCNV